MHKKRKSTHLLTSKPYHKCSKPINIEIYKYNACTYRNIMHIKNLLTKRIEESQAWLSFQLRDSHRRRNIPTYRGKREINHVLTKIHPKSFYVINKHSLFVCVSQCIMFFSNYRHVCIGTMLSLTDYQGLSSRMSLIQPPAKHVQMYICTTLSLKQCFCGRPIFSNHFVSLTRTAKYAMDPHNWHLQLFCVC